ncbi:MAG: 3-deoxy-manno-octulosonate cytidylyltransferase [Nitrospinota bacterium]|nr:3-deoxy-manno-octulosonate cytidylyltransferase [Nitrospinota bacterium]
MGGVVAIIPARYQSERFPGKPLALLKGEPVIIHVARKAAACRNIDHVIVATDSEEIHNAVTSSGFIARMTSETHQSGTDRIAEVAKYINDDIVVNIQGDEPLIDTDSVDKAVKALIDDKSLNVSTLCVPITQEDFKNPNVVKVVMDNDGNALYFSRSPIPYNRESGLPTPMKKHIGLYVYRRDFLIKYADIQPSELERVEKLEQLRILQNGTRIKVITASKDSIGIDTPEDLIRAENTGNV